MYMLYIIYLLVDVYIIYYIFIGRCIYYIGLTQTYKLQTVPQVCKIIHFAKCLEFAAFKDGGKC